MDVGHKEPVGKWNRIWAFLVPITPKYDHCVWMPHPVEHGVEFIRASVVDEYTGAVDVLIDLLHDVDVSDEVDKAMDEIYQKQPRV